MDHMTHNNIREEAKLEAGKVLNGNQYLNPDQIGKYLNLQYFSKHVIIIFC
jgi:hypothetical protein